jgi:hypothetical protein
MKSGVRYIVGKTIRTVIVSERADRTPATQVFLVFTDDTSLEFYGQLFTGTNGLDNDTEKRILEIQKRDGRYMTVWPEE